MPESDSVSSEAGVLTALAITAVTLYVRAYSSSEISKPLPPPEKDPHFQALARMQNGMDFEKIFSEQEKALIALVDDKKDLSAEDFSSWSIASAAFQNLNPVSVARKIFPSEAVRLAASRDTMFNSNKNIGAALSIVCQGDRRKSPDLSLKQVPEVGCSM